VDQPVELDRTSGLFLWVVVVVVVRVDGHR
jgi:hypothetical protein